ncbi:MAG: hypothetical protein ACP5Q0_08265 [Halothiobacillus sp.]
MHNHTLILLAIAVLLAWRMVVRVRRLVGRQQLKPARPWITLSIFSLLLGFFLLAAHDHLGLLALLLGGGALGILLGRHGLKLTQFEARPEGLFYTPHTWIGIGLSVAFMALVIYRLVLFSQTQVLPTPAESVKTPLLLTVFGGFAGYHMTYAVGLLRWRRRVSAGGGLTQATLGNNQGDSMRS